MFKCIFKFMQLRGESNGQILPRVATQSQLLVATVLNAKQTAVV